MDNSNQPPQQSPSDTNGAGSTPPQDVPPAAGAQPPMQPEQATQPEPTQEQPAGEITPSQPVIQPTETINPTQNMPDQQAAVPGPVSFEPSSETSTPTQAQSSEPTVSTTPTHPYVSSSAKDKKPIMMVALTVLLVAAIASSVYFALANNSAQNDITSLKSQIAELDRNTHELPENAIKVSECIPNMGFHYIDPSSDPRFGPYYLVSKDGDLIGYEYMFNESMLTTIPDQEIALEVLLTDGPVDLHDWQYNTIEFSRAPEGHPGFEEDHVDIHLYTVTPEVQARACE